MEKLRNAICGKGGKNLDDLEHMTGKYQIILDTNTFNQNDDFYHNVSHSISEFCHTGDIESLNSLQLKYAN